MEFEHELKAGGGVPSPHTDSERTAGAQDHAGRSPSWTGPAPRASPQVRFEEGDTWKMVTYDIEMTQCAA